MATFIKDAVKVFIARENAIDMSSFSPTGGVLSDLAIYQMSVDGIGASTLGALRRFYEIENITGVSIGNYGKENDTYQTLADPYDHDIEIKLTGSGSCDFIMKQSEAHTGTDADWDHMLLKGLAYDWPNGWNDKVSNEPVWDPTDDNDVPNSFTGGTGTDALPPTDERGYLVVVEQKIASSNFLHWGFHNVKIGCSISFANRQASRGSFTWDDARFVQFLNVANAVNSSTSHDTAHDNASVLTTSSTP